MTLIQAGILPAAADESLARRMTMLCVELSSSMQAVFDALRRISEAGSPKDERLIQQAAVAIDQLWDILSAEVQVRHASNFCHMALWLPLSAGVMAC